MGKMGRRKYNQLDWLLKSHVCQKSPILHLFSLIIMRTFTLKSVPFWTINCPPFYEGEWRKGLCVPLTPFTPPPFIFLVRNAMKMSFYYLFIESPI